MAVKMSFQRMSKNPCYESPYIFMGDIVETGLQEKPKDICKDRIIGTWKARNVEVSY